MKIATGSGPLRLLSMLRRLPAQLVLLLTLALFPLGLISLHQTSKVIEEARTLNRVSLMERTVAAGSAEREVIQRARGASEGLGAALLAVPPEACNTVLERFVSATPTYSEAWFHGPDGRLLCMSDPDAAPIEPIDISGKRGMQATVRPSVASSGRPAVRIAQPIEADGALRGYVSVSIPMTLATARASGADENGLRIAVINTAGELIATSHESGSATDFLPRDLAIDSLFELRGLTFDAPANNGEIRVFAVSKMIDGQAALVGSWPQQASFGAGWTLPTIAPMVYPVAMWLTGMLLAWFGLQRQVLRHVTALRSAMRRFALGELRGGRLTLDHPPEELRETERAFNRMVLLLAQAEAQREQDLRDKEVLLREVHHRVKNNLQLIGSIVNMQARTARSPEARRILDSLRSRVRGLATMHRTLSDTSDMAAVEASDMIESIVADSVGVARDRDRLSVTTDLDPVELYPDQAVPLSMLVAETITNALKHAGEAPPGGHAVRVALTVGEEGCVTLEIENTVGPRPPDEGDMPESSGLGGRLIQAFQRQLGGQSEVEHDAARYLYRMRFRRNGFAPQSADGPGSRPSQ